MAKERFANQWSEMWWHVRKQFETSAEQTQHLTTLAQKSDN